MCGGVNQRLSGLCGLSIQATQYIGVWSVEGRTSCVRRDTRPTWVLGGRTPLVHREGSEVG